MTTLAIGPRTPSPSWQWVGLGVAEAMRQRCQVVFFDDFFSVPTADVILIIKQRPPQAFALQARASGAQLYFAPIDVYADEDQIRADAGILRTCDAVLVHSETLLPLLAPYCQKAVFVEHPCRFALNTLVPFRKSGFLLWIGGFQHAPYLLNWLERFPPPIDVRLLTDIGTKAARLTARVTAYRLGIPLEIGNGKVNGWDVVTWCEEAQTNLMATCKAAIDIKGDDFNQITKPPTKAQQFIASGIPFCCNPGHPAIGYFRKRGFEIADAMRFETLISYDYWETTGAFAPRLRYWTSREAVGRHFHQLLAGASACDC